LSRRAASTIRGAEEILISPLTGWEVATLHRPRPIGPRSRPLHLGAGPDAFRSGGIGSAYDRGICLGRRASGNLPGRSHRPAPVRDGAGSQGSARDEGRPPALICTRNWRCRGDLVRTRQLEGPWSRRREMVDYVKDFLAPIFEKTVCSLAPRMNAILQGINPDAIFLYHWQALAATYRLRVAPRVAARV